MQVAKPFNVPLLFIEPPFFRGFSRAARMHFLRRGWLYCHALSLEPPAPAMPAMQPPRTGRKRKDACSFSLSACALVVAWGVRESCVRTGSGCFAKGMAVSPCREVVFARRKLVATCRADGWRARHFSTRKRNGKARSPFYIFFKKICLILI